MITSRKTELTPDELKFISFRPFTEEAFARLRDVVRDEIIAWCCLPVNVIFLATGDKNG